MGVFIVVCVAEKLGYMCFFAPLLVNCCILNVFLLFIMLSGCCNADMGKKKDNGLSSFQNYRLLKTVVTSPLHMLQAPGAGHCGSTILDTETFIFTCPITVGVFGAPQVTSQPVSSILLFSPLSGRTWQTPDLSIP